jgi:nitrate reductase NapE component
MLEHLVIATDPYFGKDILENAAGGAQLTAIGFKDLWEQTLNGNLYASMCKVGQLFAIATLTLFMVELGKNWINQEDMKALTSWIWPILVVGLLANNGTMLRSGTFTIRSYINTINNNILEFTVAGANLEVAFNRAAGNVALQLYVGKEMERCRSIAGTTQDAIACLQRAEAELKSSTPKLFKQDVPDSDSWEFNPLKSLEDAKDALENLTSGQVLEKVGNTITTTIGSMVTGFVAVILLALNNAYQWGIEFTMLLTALVGPLAVGGSLLPFGIKPIFAWLTGYFSVGMAKLCFNIIIGLCGQLIASSQENQPMIFLLFVGLISPILASALATAGGLAVWTGLGKVAAFGGEVAAGMTLAGARTTATVAVNATKFVASKVKK